MTDKNELKIIGLVQRIGEITSKYELQIIEMRADMTLELQRLSDENNRLSALLEEKDVAISKED